jgi:hypothetical protein
MQWYNMVLERTGMDRLQVGRGRRYPSPLFFVSVDSKEVRCAVSPLDATFRGGLVSVASKGVSDEEKWRVTSEGKDWAAPLAGNQGKKGGGVRGKGSGRTEGY